MTCDKKIWCYLKILNTMQIFLSFLIFLISHGCYLIILNTMQIFLIQVHLSILDAVILQHINFTHQSFFGIWPHRIGWDLLMEIWTFDICKGLKALEDNRMKHKTKMTNAKTRCLVHAKWKKRLILKKNYLVIHCQF